MSYEVKGQILGFENTMTVDIHEVDELFSTMIDVNNENISFTLANPYVLREYSFDLPTNLKVLLDIKEDSKVNVYNIVVIQEPLEKSSVNFLAPIIVNEDNKTVGQAVLNSKTHPDFGMAETIESFKQ
ncbi:flagellar assembly protein FliW [Sulfurimonas lithotrophica]|uniref:Flagellar assembly factor FliW n=1 Tax=Sulfurimonas lithotrophica TaxID=2590022 RepID=A0A5P8NXQ6_9BACT|nr:flagellar assembly protein FliW [Sulfurimonas lithotrophica]QFR48197.1 flagellar assembly protein FliW [Sulfurimonas lithotrophica]